MRALIVGLATIAVGFGTFYDKALGQSSSEVGYGEVCSDGGYNYSEQGPYGHKYAGRLDRFKVYVPHNFGDDGCTYPVVGFAPGIVSPTALYKHFFKQLTSWGFVVVVDTNIAVNITARGLTGALEKIYKDAKYKDHLAPKAGILGHSMGGGAVINANGRKIVSSIVALQPGPLGLTATTKPTLFLGGTADLFGVFTRPNGRYKMAKGPRFLAVLEGGRHIGDSYGPGKGSKRSKLYKGAFTGWFKCTLARDRGACDLFNQSHKDSCELPGKWALCQGAKLNKI